MVAVDINAVDLTNINFEIYTDGSHEPGGVATIDLPEINFMSSEVTGAGILGQYDASVMGHTENMETTLHFRTIRQDLSLLLSQGQAVMLSAYGASQMYDAGTGGVGVNPVRVVMRGIPKSLKAGKFEPGESSETEVTLTLDYVKITANSKDVLEIDKFNYIFNVNGIDIISDVRSALGI